MFLNKCTITGIFFLSILLIGTTVSGQGLLRNGITKMQTDTIVTDSLPVLRSTVNLSVNGVRIDTFELSADLQSLILPQHLADEYGGSTLSYSYRVFAFALTSPYQHLDSTVMSPFDDGIYIGGDVYNQGSTEASTANDLQYRGSFSRGFSVGNAQSLILNSNFNLQLAGDLGSGIKVAAAISDDNIPIQPQGNTQRLQEFDRVFIKVSKGESEITAGDYPLTRPKGYFTNYNKKLKGLTARNRSDLGNYSITTDASIAASRGKFARQTVVVQEGNQGPYKLNGNNGERFLIVLSGTEKIYADGRLLARGFDYDYVIDYNRAEIAFTPTFPIRRETRIIAEFEYTDQSYLRTLYAANTYLNSKHLDVNINFYSEQDSKTATGDIVLDQADLDTLSKSGDNLDRAVRSGIFVVPDSARLLGQVTYILVDDPDSTNPTDSILIYSDDPELRLVTAAFTEVGTKQGRYVIDQQNTANGRVYTYVGPSMGSHEPILRVTPPEQRRLISIGSTYRPTDRLSTSAEISLSSTDINRLSTIDDEDNNGMAGQMEIEYILPLGSTWQLHTEAHYEGLQSDYLPLNPYRNAEFVRDWNTSPLLSGAENLYNLSAGVSRGDSIEAMYQYRDYSVGNVYTGNIHKITGKYIAPYGLSASGFVSQLRSITLQEETTFGRTLVDASQLLHEQSATTIAVQYDAELNEQYTTDSSQSLSSQSRGYQLATATLTGSPLPTMSYKLQYRKRYDQFPTATELVRTLDIDEIHIGFDWKVSAYQKLKLSSGYRRFEVADSLLAPDQSDKNTLLGRLDYTANTKSGFLVSSTNYTINSGQQPKVEFYFEEVLVGQGDYIYVGNEDSTLINANFRYAPDLGTANYIRLSLVNGEFVTTTNQSLAQTIRITPAKLFNAGTELVGWRRLISKVALLTNINLDKKAQADGSFRLFDFSQQDPDVVQYNGLVSNTLFFNRGQRSYDLQFNQKSNTSVFTQVSGLEQRYEDSYNLKARIAAARSTDFILEATMGNRRYFSEIFVPRNYDINFFDLSPKISYRPSDRFRAIIDYTYDSRHQTIAGMESATSHQIGLDITYRSTALANISANARYIGVRSTAVDDSAIQFDLLRGLRDGRNILWSTSITRRLSNAVDISFTYEGRQNGDAPAVHIGRAQAKATF